MQNALSSSEVSAPSTDFVIVTALREELDAVLNKIPAFQQLPPGNDDIRTYYQADFLTTFPDNTTGKYHVIVVGLLGMGQIQAVMATADAIRKWQPRYVMLIGIAGGIANQNVQVGDILISDQVVHYELQKLTPGGPQIRWEVYRADARLLNACKYFQDESWQQLIKVKRPGRGKPTCHIGPIASGDKVIAVRDALARYQEDWPKLIGVEMEAAGISTAAFQSSIKPGFLMIRGVSDLADENKNTAAVKKWRAYACDAAASFAFTLLRTGPVPLAEGAVQFKEQVEMANADDKSDDKSPEPLQKTVYNIHIHDGKGITIGDGSRVRQDFAEDHTSRNINTGGGAYIEGSVSTGGGNFVGRDQITTPPGQFAGAAQTTSQDPPHARQSANPFGETGRISDQARFFDREELLRQVFEELRKGSSLSLVGESQVGKSSILEMICARGPAELGLPGAAFVYLSLEVVDDEEEFYEALCDALEIDTCRGYTLTRALKGRRFILCLDEIEKMTWDGFSVRVRSQLRGLADGASAPLRLVIVSRSPLSRLFPDSPENDSPLAGLCTPLRVEPFAPDIARRFLLERLAGTGVQFSEAQIAALLRETGGHPGRLQQAAAALYREMR